MRPTKKVGEQKSFVLNVALKHDGSDCLIWPYRKNHNGYAVAGFGNGPIRVSRFVCQAANGEPPDKRYEAAHTCGNRACVSAGHLRWATPKVNQADRWEHGTEPRGEKNSCAKLSENDVREIKKLLPSIEKKVLAKRFNVSPTAIWHIETGRNWGWLV